MFFFFNQSLFSQISYKEPFPNLSFNFPTEIQPSIDGTNRIFLVEQPGVIKVFPNKENVTAQEKSTFLDISQSVAYSTGSYCISSDNRSIFIESLNVEEFNAPITGEDKNRTIVFTETLTIADLDKGEYNLCISSNTSINYQNCSKIITEPLPLSVLLDFVALTNNVNLK